ncbi:MAG: glucose-6-phosphate dehydrogenase, partial [Paludibacteraceae bacterium]|nr:glucose-6-phosphate dehydrogenase [Paludibacteraceae bacterium]
MEKFIVVIFGASGDLAWRKLMPALYNLHQQKMLPESFKVLGVGRMNMTDESFRAKTLAGLKEFVPENKYTDKGALDFGNYLHFQSMDTNQLEDYAGLKTRLETLSQELACNANYLFYYATPPLMYTTITQHLHAHQLTCQDKGWKRVIIEKPYGHDLASALELTKELSNAFSEEQIYRIDHYLGKETVQNILVTRFSNSIFEPLWNHNYVKYIEITSSESLGVGSRSGYYDTAGAMRDMVQNHLLQLLAIVAMEPPATANGNAIRDEMVKVFQSLRPIKEEEVPQYVVRGQYTSSKINGETVKAYREEAGIAPNSKTETYMAMACYIDNWRWSGVPFYIRTGKRLPTHVTEIVIHFKPNPHRIFAQKDGLQDVGNQLIIRIQPDEGLLLKIGMKVPGGGFEVEKVALDFHYSSLTDHYIPQAYERLLCDCMQGDSTLFQRNDA